MQRRKLDFDPFMSRARLSQTPFRLRRLSWSRTVTDLDLLVDLGIYVVTEADLRSHGSDFDPALGDNVVNFRLKTPE